jgi:SulP family sulfate permease
MRMADPDRRHLLLIGTGINFIDVAGAELLVDEAKASRDAGGALYLCKLKPVVQKLLKRGGYVDLIGRAHILDTKDEAIRAIYARLDVGRCRTCTARIFNECQTVLPDGSHRTP